MRRSVRQASTCGQVRRSLELCCLAAHGVLWDGHYVSPHEEVNKRSRFARVVVVAAGAVRASLPRSVSLRTGSNPDS